MSETTARSLGLTEVLTDLRDEISRAAQAAQHDDLRFAMSSVTVNLTIAIEATRTGTAGINVWVVQATGERASTNSQTHQLSLELKPLSVASGQSPWVDGEADQNEL